MKPILARAIKLAALTTALVGVLVVAGAIPGAATPPDRFVTQVLGRGTYVSHGSLPLGENQDIVVARIVVPPGGASGWHSHPGGAIVIIQQGEMTTYESVGEHCLVIRYTQGQSFIERPGHDLIAFNTGSTDTTIIATFPGVPVGGSPRIDASNPGTCLGV